MRRETLAALDEAWMRKLKIAPLVLNADLLDLRKDFRTKLYESLLKQGWDSSQSMIIASSSDPKLDGQILQGRHRAITINQILKDGHKFDTSKILIRREEVRNVDELRAKRAAYEAAASLTKDPKMSKKWIQANLHPIIKNNIQQGHSKILSYLHDCGFYNDSIASELIEHELEQMEKRRARKAKAKMSQIPEDIRNQTWKGPVPETIDDATSYIRRLAFKCEKCGHENIQDVNVAISHKGDLIKLATVPLPDN